MKSTKLVHCFFPERLLITLVFQHYIATIDVRWYAVSISSQVYALHFLYLRLVELMLYNITATYQRSPSILESYRTSNQRERHLRIGRAVPGGLPLLKLRSHRQATPCPTPHLSGHYLGYPILVSWLNLSNLDYCIFLERSCVSKGLLSNQHCNYLFC